eukprot:3906391-Prymnesium_polylepis.1
MKALPLRVDPGALTLLPREPVDRRVFTEGILLGRLGHALLVQRRQCVELPAVELGGCGPARLLDHLVGESRHAGDTQQLHPLLHDRGKAWGGKDVSQPFDLYALVRREVAEEAQHVATVVAAGDFNARGTAAGGVERGGTKLGVRKQLSFELWRDGVEDELGRLGARRLTVRRLLTSFFFAFLFLLRAALGLTLALATFAAAARWRATVATPTRGAIPAAIITFIAAAAFIVTAASVCPLRGIIPFGRQSVERLEKRDGDVGFAKQLDRRHGQIDRYERQYARTREHDLCHPATRHTA